MSREAVARAGHFTTMQVRGGAVQGLELHLARLVEASGQLYGASPGTTLLKRHIREALADGGQTAGDCTVRVRILPPFPEGPGDGKAWISDEQPPVAVDIEPPRRPPAAPLRLRTHPGLRALPSVKHLALGFQLQARAQARAAGFDDAVLLASDGRISEGTFWNIVFWDGQAFAWPDAPALAGVTLKLLRGAVEQARIPQARRALTVDSLAGLVAGFALNSTGIAVIDAIDDHRFPGDPDAERRLRELLAGVPWEPL